MDKFLQDRLNNNMRRHEDSSRSENQTVVDVKSFETVKARWLGRARRSEYLPIAIGCNVFLYFLAELSLISVCAVIVSIIVVIILIVESIRRLHDLGRSGWWVLTFIIPFFWLMTWCEGEAGPNKYGPDPRASKGGDR